MAYEFYMLIIVGNADLLMVGALVMGMCPAPSKIVQAIETDINSICI